ncbi:MAG TPA: hypothetical protein VM099_12015 [Gemmatimonadaceae bacterium]|nr:hypothetical protein [Gemmatimonadaceae bacterium]
MTAPPFVTSLRNNGEVIVLEAGSEPVLHLRVQVIDLWDSIRVDAPASEPVISVKRAALDALYPDGVDADGYVVRLHGFEILDESASLAAAGVRNGSILLLVNRRRQPVR